jgi:hypothetical protein
MIRRRFTRAIIALAAIAAAPTSTAITESQAMDLVFKAMRKVDPQVRTDCLSLMVESHSHRAFEIAVREKHGGPCPGDSHVSPVVERFRVTHSPVQIWRYDAIEDKYRHLPFKTSP